MKNSNLITNHLFEVEVATMVESVDQNWKKFKREDLARLVDAADSILQLNSEDAYVINSKDGAFDNYLQVRIPQEIERHSNINCSPIPKFFIGRNRNSNSLTIIEVGKEIYLSPDNHPEYIIFLAFKLALIESDLTRECILYVINKYYLNNPGEFLNKLNFMLADYSSIFGERKVLLAQILFEIQNNTGSIEKGKTFGVVLKNDNPVKINNAYLSISEETESNLNDVDGTFLRRQVMFFHYLFEASREERAEIPSRSEEARIIHAILGKKVGKVIGGTNIYKYLEKLLTNDEATNVRNLQYVRSMFESLLLTKATQLINKDLK